MTRAAAYKLVRRFPLPAETLRHIWLLPRLSTISFSSKHTVCETDGFLPRQSACPAETVRVIELHSESAKSVRVIVIPVESRQEAESRGQTGQKTFYHAQQSQKEARNRRTLGGSSITDTIGRERKLAD